jgi:hypothetical protein
MCPNGYQVRYSLQWIIYFMSKRGSQASRGSQLFGFDQGRCREFSLADITCDLRCAYNPTTFIDNGGNS